MTDEARGVFLGQRRDRMGARLLMTLTCIRLAEDFDSDYRINWFPQGADAPELEQPEELFSQDWMDRHFVDAETYKRLYSRSKPIWTFLNDTSPDRIQAHLAEGRAVIVEEGFEVLTFPWEDIETIRPRYHSFIDRIGFTPEIRSIMDKADAALGGKGVSAYHIRRGDILNAVPWKHTTWPAKIEPEEYYERHLEKNPDVPAVMFSDQPELLKRFQERYPNLLTMSDIADLSRLTRAQRDFLELFTMSRADQVVAPILSAFSMAAARMSGRQRMMFRDVLGEEEMTQARTRVIDRVAKGPGAFLNTSEAAHVYAKAAQYLNAEGRTEEAHDLAKPILDAGADNAFLPMLQALNLFYLKKWAEAERLAKTGMENPHLWPEDYACLCALRGAILGARKKNWGAGRYFSRAFWAKPLRPDVVIIGSRMLYRGQIPARLFPPVDWETLKAVRRRSFVPFNNLHLVQHKMIKRSPCNFDMVLLDWSDFVLDQKARRLISSPDRLATLHTGMGKAFARDGVDRDAPASRSLEATLGWRTVDLSISNAIDLTRAVIAEEPKNPLYHKRLADMHEAEGDTSAARIAYGEAISNAPENPYLIFAMGRFLERTGDTDQGETLILESASLDSDTAAIQGAAGHILLRRGEIEEARSHLEVAQELCPTFKRFSNQLQRADEKQRL